mgnify:FL=1
MDSLAKALESFRGIINKVHDGLEKVGAFDAEENLKFYPSGSRTRLFIKCARLPGSPSIELTVDLPGESDAIAVSVIKGALEKLGAGNALPSATT